MDKLLELVKKQIDLLLKGPFEEFSQELLDSLYYLFSLDEITIDDLDKLEPVLNNLLFSLNPNFDRNELLDMLNMYGGKMDISKSIILSKFCEEANELFKFYDFYSKIKDGKLTEAVDSDIFLSISLLINPKNGFTTRECASLLRELTVSNCTLLKQSTDDLIRERKNALKDKDEEDEEKKLSYLETLYEKICRIVSSLEYAGVKDIKFDKEIKEEFDLSEATNEFDYHRYDLVYLYHYITSFLIPIYESGEKSYELIKVFSSIIEIFESYDKFINNEFLLSLKDRWQRPLEALNEKDSIMNKYKDFERLSREEQEKLINLYNDFSSCEECIYYLKCIKLREMVTLLNNDIASDRESFSSRNISDLELFDECICDSLESMDELISFLEDYYDVELGKGNSESVSPFSIRNLVIIRPGSIDYDELSSMGAGTIPLTKTAMGLSQRFFMVDGYNSHENLFGRGQNYGVLKTERPVKSLNPCRARKSDIRLAYIRIYINPKNIERLKKDYPSLSDDNLLFFVFDVSCKKGGDNSYVDKACAELEKCTSFDDNSKVCGINYNLGDTFVNIKKIFEEEFTDESYAIACKLINSAIDEYNEILSNARRLKK